MGSSASRSSNLNLISKHQTNHLVSLKSTTYGSLSLTDHTPKPSFNNQHSDDPLSPHSVINTWELMEGLDDDEAFDFQIVDFAEKTSKKVLDLNSIDIVNSFEFVDHPVVSKTLWQHLSDESNVVSSYPQPLTSNKCEKRKDVSIKVQNIESLVCNNDYCDLLENRIVLYYTSLRGIRKTYEDCCAVRVIFRGFRVCVEEKDISMDRSYRMELQEALKGNGISLPAVSLPQVFIKGKYIGGAEEIKQLNEGGELAKILEGVPFMDLAVVCESCGDARFVPCSNCNGSRKVYEEEEGNSRRCDGCNENGLIRCSNCCP